MVNFEQLGAVVHAPSTIHLLVDLGLHSYHWASDSFFYKIWLMTYTEIGGGKIQIMLCYLLSIYFMISRAPGRQKFRVKMLIDLDFNRQEHGGMVPIRTTLHRSKATLPCSFFFPFYQRETASLTSCVLGDKTLPEKGSSLKGKNLLPGEELNPIEKGGQNENGSNMYLPRKMSIDLIPGQNSILHAVGLSKTHEFLLN